MSTPALCESVRLRERARGCTEELAVSCHSQSFEEAADDGEEYRQLKRGSIKEPKLRLQPAFH